MKNRLLIVDGHNLLFQMFYGMPNRIINKDGKQIHAIIGFVGALNKLIEMIHPTHIVILFDSEKPNKRNEILNDYKGNRVDYSKVPQQDNPFSQLDDIYKALDYMNIKYIEVEEYETDDVVSSYTKYYGLYNEIYISSYDSDYFQLINRNVKVIRYRGKHSIICDYDYIFNKFNLQPVLYADYKSLIGDISDNIKGIKGIGSKTASKIINMYGSIHQIYNNIEVVYDEKIKKLLIKNKELVKRNYQLIKLDSKANIPFALEKLIYKNNKLKTMDVIKAIG